MKLEIVSGRPKVGGMERDCIDQRWSERFRAVVANAHTSMKKKLATMLGEPWCGTAITLRELRVSAL